MSDYAKPDVLVDTDWVETHGGDDGVRLIEVDEDSAAYDKGHIDGAVGWNWTTDLHTKVGREYVSQAELAELLSNAASDRTRPSSCTAATTTGSRPTRTGS